MGKEGKRSVLFYSPQFLPSVGGLQLTVHHWAAALSGMGYRITVCTATPGAGKDEAPYSIVRTTSPLTIYGLMCAHEGILFFNMSLKAIPIAWLSGRRVWISHHTLMPHKGMAAVNGRLKKWLSRQGAKAQFACSHFVAGTLKNCGVIYSPYNEKLMYPGDGERHPNHLLFMGRWVSDKGIITLLEAFERLCQEDPAYRLTICGDGPLHAAIADKVQQAYWADRVTLLPFQPQAAAARQYRQHALVVVPSTVEPYGMVVAEALACGCRVVASTTGGLPEAGGKFATYAAPGDAIALADAIKKALHLPEPDRSGVQLHLADKNIAATSRQLDALLSEKPGTSHND